MIIDTEDYIVGIVEAIDKEYVYIKINGRLL